MDTSTGTLLGTRRPGRLGALDVVRISAGGSASRRAALFAPGLVARSWRAGVAPGARLLRALRLPIR